VTSPDLTAWLATYRRPLAGALAGLTVLLLVSALRPQTVPIVVAARDLPAGRQLGLADLRVENVPGTVVPDGAVRGPTVFGRVLAIALRRGTPITDVALISNGPPNGRVAVPVELSDPAATSALTVGDVVDVLATRPPQVAVLATDARVLDLPGSTGLVVLALTRPQALHVAAAGDARLSVVIEP
jgi:Flp pilus assembly protein CpaB